MPPRRKRAAPQHLGETRTSGQVTIYARRHRSEGDVMMTDVHEGVHQTLLWRTAFGHFTHYLDHLSKKGLKKRQAALCFREQLEVQEVAAYYISIVARVWEHPHEASGAIRLVPSEFKGPLSRVTKLLPLNDASDGRLLYARALIVEAIARLAFSGSTLRVFEQPRSLTVERLERHLRSDGPRTRFRRILIALEKGHALDGIAAEARAAIRNDLPRKVADHVLGVVTARLAEALRGTVEITDILHALAQTIAFHQAWTSVCGDLPFAVPQESQASIDHTPDDVRGTDEERVSRDLLRKAFEGRARGRPEFFLFVSMVTREDASIHLFHCTVDDNWKVDDPDPFGRFFNGDFIKGSIKAVELADVLKAVPNGSVVVSFYKSSWIAWQNAVGAKPTAAFALRGVLDWRVGPQEISELLAFPGLGRTSPWYGEIWSGGIRLGVFLSASDPSAFGVVVFQGSVALERFVQLMTSGKLPMANRSQIRSRNLMSVAAFPLIANLMSE